MIALIGLIAFMTIVTGVCNQIAPGELLVYICFQIFCMTLPGAAVMALVPIKNLRRIEKLTLIYASGYMLTILLYTALMLTVGIRYVRGAFFLLPVLSCAVLALKRNQKKDLAQEVEAEFSDGEGNEIGRAHV